MNTIYDSYIEYLKNEEKKGFKSCESLDLEKHHIVPLHDGGEKNGPVVLCTRKNHTLAHYYGYLTYQQRGDFVAFTMRWNQKLGVSERIKLAVESNKRLKNTFWNSDWQSIQGKKGGKKSGKQNALCHRQGFVLSETLKRSTYWEFVKFRHDFFIPFEKKPVCCKVILQTKMSIVIEK
jgi:hypothetical protein